MKALLCDQPQDDEPALLCPQHAVYGTTRCLQHTVPTKRDVKDPRRGTVYIHPLIPLPPDPLRTALAEALFEARLKHAVFKEQPSTLNEPVVDSRKPEGWLRRAIEWALGGEAA